MYARELRIYQFLLGYCRQLLSGISEVTFHTPYPAGGNSPSWIVGHLALTADFGLSMLGKKGLCPKEWEAWFGPGSKPAETSAQHPSRAVLMQALEHGHEAFAAALAQADPALLDKPTPFPPLAQPFPTVGDLIAHLLTSHEATHLGQLSICRRGEGHPPLF